MQLTTMEMSEEMAFESESETEYEGENTRGLDSKKSKTTCSSESDLSTRDGEVFLVRLVAVTQTDGSFERSPCGREVC